MKHLFFFIEDITWNIRCSYNFWLHGGYGLAKVIEKIPFRYLVKYLKKYGATIGENCLLERGLNIHRPFGKNKPLENLILGNKVYLGHNLLIDLSRTVTIGDSVLIGARSQIWTHVSYYSFDESGEHIYNEKFGSVVIQKGCFIGAGCVLLHDINLGRYSIIGASSMVNKSVGDFEFWSGVPANFIKKK